jgi:drug/metabolite transporter (DMT)-like permease
MYALNRMKNKLINNGILSLLLTSFIFGFFGVIASLLGQRFSVFVIVLFVNIIQLIAFGIISLIRRESFALNRKAFISILIFGVINSLPILFFNLAVSVENLGSVLLVQNVSTIIFSVIFSYFGYKEELNYLQIGLIILALLGIAIIYLPSQNPNLLGLFFAVLVGLFNGTANVFRRNLGSTISPFVLSFYTSVIGTVIFGILAREQIFNSISNFDVQSVSLILLYGGLNIATTYLLIKGFTAVKFTIGNLVLLLEVVFGSIFGLLFLSQGLEYLQLIGNLIVFVSLVLIRLVDMEKQSQ